MKHEHHLLHTTECTVNSMTCQLPTKLDVVSLQILVDHLLFTLLALMLAASALLEAQLAQLAGDLPLAEAS